MICRSRSRRASTCGLEVMEDAVAGMENSEAELTKRFLLAFFFFFEERKRPGMAGLSHPAV